MSVLLVLKSACTGLRIQCQLILVFEELLLRPTLKNQDLNFEAGDTNTKAPALPDLKYDPETLALNRETLNPYTLGPIIKPQTRSPVETLKPAWSPQLLSFRV